MAVLSRLVGVLGESSRIHTSPVCFIRFRTSTLTGIYSSRKSSAGYNLNGLFVGSEGTLGIVTEITLKLAPAPETTAVAVVSFQSMRSAAQAAVAVVQKGIPINCVEILDDVQMRCINRIGSTDRVWKEAPTLFFKFAGSKGIVKECITEVGQIIQEYGGSGFEFSKDEKSQKQLWSARKEALWSLLSLRTSGTGVWSTDVAVPLSRVADLIGGSKASPLARLVEFSC